MKLLRFVIPAVLLLLSPLAFAQSHEHKAGNKPAPSDALKSFDTLKSLAGVWVGTFTVDPPQKDMGDGSRTQISMRVTSRGNALVHEMFDAGKPDDPARYDHPLTMFYLDGDRLFLTHYCDAGNRPRMTGKLSADGKKVEFEFVDLSGGNQFGHMYHAVFTMIDASHHIEEWTYMMPGDKPLRARVELQRQNQTTATGGQ